MPMVYSTLTETQKYTKWEKAGEVYVEVGSVVINGGHGKADKRTLITPIGVGTEVTDEQLEMLNSIKAFQDHKDAGFIEIVMKGKKEAEKVAAGMAGKDGLAQLSESDFADASDSSEGGTPKKAKIKK